MTETQPTDACRAVDPVQRKFGNGALAVTVSDEAKFQIGDRVRVKATLADGFLLPERKFVRDGRIATVKYLPDEKRWRRSYRIEFDVKRSGAQPTVINVDGRYLEAVTNAE